MNVNFGIIINLGADYGQNANFGLVLDGGVSKFKWSIGPRDGYKTGILTDEWCTDVSNSVDVERGGGVASVGGFNIIVGNGSQIYKILDALPIQGSTLEVLELPLKKVFVGRVDYYNWDDHKLTFYAESLDATSDVELSDVVNDVVVPVQFGILPYAIGKRVEEQNEVLTVPGIGHESPDWVVRVARAEYMDLQGASTPTDWAGAVSYLQALIGQGLCVFWNGQFREVVTLVDNSTPPLYQVRITTDTNFEGESVLQPPIEKRFASFNIFKNAYQFDTWAVSIRETFYSLNSGNLLPLDESAFTIDGTKALVKPSKIQRDRIVSATYRKSFQTVLKPVSYFSAHPTNALSSIASGSIASLSNGSIANPFTLSYSADIGSFSFLTVSPITKGDTTIGLVGPGPFTINGGQGFRLINAEGELLYLVAKSTSVALDFGSIWAIEELELLYPADKDFEPVFPTFEASRFVIGLDTKDVLQGLGDGSVYLACDFQVDKVNFNPNVYIQIRGISWDGQSFLLNETPLQQNADYTKIANLPDSFGGGNSPTSYPSDKNAFYVGGNGWEQTKIADSWDELRKYRDIRVEIFVASFQNGITSNIYLREFGFGIANEVSISDTIYAQLKGRSVGIDAKDTWTEALFTPRSIATYLRQIMNYGDTPPDAGWGRDFGQGSTRAFRPIRWGQGGYLDTDIVEWGFSQNVAMHTAQGLGLLDALNEIMRENFVINWRDNNGLDGVAQILRSYNNDITTRIGLCDVLDVSVEEFDSSRVFCNPVIKWGENPDGTYQGIISITKAEVDIVGEANQAACVIGSTKDEAGKALLWRRARALYLKYRSVVPTPDDVGVLQWCGDASSAEWYLDNLLSWMGVNGSAVVSPRRSFRIVLPYEVANDQTGRKFDVGSRFILNLPHQTDGDDWECICVAVSHDLVGLSTSVEAIGFRSADWPTDVEPSGYIQDVYEDVLTTWEDSYTATDIKEDSWP